MFFKKKDDVTKKIERAILKKKCQLVAMYIVGAIAVVTGYYSYLGYKEIAGQNNDIFIENVHAMNIQPAEKKETTQDIIVRVAKEQGFEDTKTLLAIAKCESGFDKYARNSVSSARGLYQVLDMHSL